MRLQYRGSKDFMLTHRTSEILSAPPGKARLEVAVHPLEELVIRYFVVLLSVDGNLQNTTNTTDITDLENLPYHQTLVFKERILLTTFLMDFE
jgi:hypothetical protein